MTIRAGLDSPLRDRGFLLLVAGQFTSTVGDYCYAVALPWLVLSAHGGPGMLGAVLACYGVPRTVTIPLGGIVTDRIGARTVMLGADLVRGAMVLMLAVLAATGLPSLAVLGPVAAVLGAGAGVFLPASFAVLPSLLPAERLQSGNALSSTTLQVGALVGPALGGAVTSLSGPAPGFAIDAASFAVSALTLALIPWRRAAAAAGARAGAAADGEPASNAAVGEPADDVAVAPTARPAGATGVPQAGPAAAAPEQKPGVWPLLRRSREFQVFLLVVVAANIALGGLSEVVLPTLAHQRFGAGAYGGILAGLAFGGMAGALLSGRIGTTWPPVVRAAASYLCEAAAMALVPFLGGLPGAVAAMAAVGLCNGYGNVVMITMVQKWAPPRLLGRVMSLIMLAAMGSFPLSVAVAGVLVRAFGPVPLFPAAATLLAVAVLVGQTQPRYRALGTREDRTALLDEARA